MLLKKSEVRTAVKTVEAALNNNDLETAKSCFRNCCEKKLDKAATKGLIHKKTLLLVKKSRLAKRLSVQNA
ncbi:hypothetical protein GCM10020331_038370 [Ectobacillus funiculus]